MYGVNQAVVFTEISLPSVIYFDPSNSLHYQPTLSNLLVLRIGARMSNHPKSTFPRSNDFDIWWELEGGAHNSWLLGLLDDDSWQFSYTAD